MSTCVSLAQMVDLALGTPEVGAVNFNVLHTLLHAMLSRLDLRGVQAEISKEGSSLLTRNKSDASATDSSGIGTDTEDSPKLKDGVIPQTQSVYHVLEKKVGKLEEQMEKLNALPSNNELFERTKPVGDGERPRPVADMWQSVQLKNRVDANEEGIGKLMSLVEDLMAEMAKIKEDSEKMRKDVDNYNIPGLRTDVDDLRKQLSELDIQSLRDFMDQLKKQMDEIDIQSLRDFMDHLEKQMGELTNKMNDMTDMDELRKRLKQLEDLTNELNDRLSQYPSVDSFTNFVTWTALEEALKGIRSELEPKERIVIEMQTQTSRPPSGKKPSRPPSATSHTPSVPSRPHSASSRTSMSGPSHELAAMLEKLGELNIRHDKLEVRVENLEEEMPNKADKSALSGLSAGPTDIPEDLLAQLQDLQNQLKSLSKAREKWDEDSGGLSRLQQVVLQLQAELDKLSSTTERIVDDNNNKTKQIESLTSTAEKLDRVKADKDYVQSEVDVKADKRLVEGKVNRSLFDQTTDELNNMIKDLLDKLTGHEDEWKQALGLMNEDIDGKLDRLEFGPIRDELERRLKALARQLRELSFGQENGEDDAAGLRKQLLQRFHCISCDRPVEIMPQGDEVAVLKDERPIPSIPAPGALPATRSSRPYTTFELEQIRQHARSLNQPGVEVVDLYATSRACGGSHTTTHPHRRFTRVTQYNNLFREEEGAAPPPACKEELDIQGADGHIYKGRLEARLPTTLQQSGPANLVSGPKQGGNSPKMTRKVVYPPAAGAPRPPATAPPAQSAPIVPRPTSARQPLSNGVQPARPQSATGQNKGTPMEVPTADTLPDPPPPSSPAAAEATDS